MHVRHVDLLDGTPVLDLKPYVAYADAHVDARAGWLEAHDPLPAWEVAFEEEIEFEGGLGFLRIWGPAKRIGETVARFRQVNMDRPHVHHDALEFPKGEVVLLTRLCDGQFATVLQLPAMPRTAEEAEEQKRVAVVA